MTATYSNTCTPARSLTPSPTNTGTPTVVLTSTLTLTATPGTADLFFISKNIFTAQDPVSIRVATSEHPGYYAMNIFNSAGENIKTMDKAYLTAPFEKSYTWDGTNKYGAKCASGVYVIYVAFPVSVKKGRVIFLH